MQLTLATSPDTRKTIGNTSPLGVIFFSSNMISMRSDIIEEIGINEDKRLYIKPGKEKFNLVYRTIY